MNWIRTTDAPPPFGERVIGACLFRPRNAPVQWSQPYLCVRSSFGYAGSDGYGAEPPDIWCRVELPSPNYFLTPDAKITV